MSNGQYSPLLRRTVRTVAPAGFTLLEILVVMMVFALIAGIASVSIGRSTSSRTYEQARQLYLQLKLAREDSVLLNRQYGIELKIDNSDVYSYSWLTFSESEEKWNSLSDDSLRGKRFHPDIDIQLDVQDTVVNLDNRRNQDSFRDAEDEEEERIPQILLLSSGEVTPFEMRFENRRTAGEAENTAVILQGDLLGRMKLFYEAELYEGTIAN